jgi:hypothetical protein
MNDQWNGPRVHRTDETANEHYTPPARPQPTLQHPVANVLNAERVRWKFNHDAEWQYGKPISYTVHPSFIIERESDGLRVGVLASFNPEPVLSAEDSTLESVIMRADVEWTGMAEATRGHYDVFVSDRVREWLTGTIAEHDQAHPMADPIADSGLMQRVAKQ